ncbi:MAG TPA: OmpA family protein [Gemmatimonadales bacterium]|jgi:peptidoglycan-associated lipoprotein|nr:OmpA family protein [Gemmatimonadales bacterium]
MFTGPRLRAAAVALALVVGLAGCAAKVTRQDFNTEIAKVREEMQAGDRRVGTRIDSTNLLVNDHTRRLDALDQELQAFRSEYNVSIEKLNGMLKFNVPVHFDFAKSELREADRPVLDRFASVVRDYYPGALVTVEGFTDPAGSVAYNKRLGRRRADAVKEYLATAGGFQAVQLKAVSYGESRNRQVVPGAKGPGDLGVENRRVTLVIDHAAIATDQVAAVR